MNIDSQILDILKENKIEFMSEIQVNSIIIVYIITLHYL